MKNNIKKLRQMKLLTIHFVRKNLKTLRKPARKFLSKLEYKFGQISAVILLRLWVNLWKKFEEFTKKVIKCQQKTGKLFRKYTKILKKYYFE